MSKIISLVFLVGCLFNPLIGQELNHPKLLIEQNTYNFGRVVEGTVVEHNFVLKNIGSSDLAINDVVASCGCTVGDLDSDKIAPGGSAALNVKFDTDGFSGKKYKSVRIYTNDPDQVSALVSMSGSIEKEVLADPDRVFLPDYIKGLSANQPQKLLIKVREDSKTKIKSVKNLSKHVVVEKLITQDKFYKLNVSIAPNAPIGDLRERLVVELANNKRRSINVPIFASIRGPVKIEPIAVSFGLIKNPRPVVKKVKIINDGEEAIEILSYESKHEAIALSLETIKAGFEYQLSVTLDPSKISQELKTLVEIKTNSLVESDLSFNIYAVLPASS